MPLCNDVSKIAQHAAFDDLHRTIILVDRLSGKSAWGRFVHRYDQSQEYPIGSLFDSTLTKLAASPEAAVHSVDSLPIVANIGKAKVTIVTRFSTTEYKIHDAEGQPALNHMGLG